MREAARANLMKARAAARMRNIERAWARQRDKTRPPAGRYRHGAYSKDLRLGWAHRLRAQQRWVVRAMKEWEQEIEGEAEKAQPEVDRDEVMQDLDLARGESPASPNNVCATPPWKQESITAK